MEKKLSAKQKQDIQVKMVSAINQALSYKAASPNATIENIMAHVVTFSSQQKDNVLKFSMIAAASKALDISERNPKLKDKDVLAKTLPELQKLIDVVAEDHLK